MPQVGSSFNGTVPLRGLMMALLPSVFLPTVSSLAFGKFDPPDRLIVSGLFDSGYEILSETSMERKTPPHSCQAGLFRTE